VFVPAGYVREHELGRYICTKEKLGLSFLVQNTWQVIRKW